MSRQTDRIKTGMRVSVPITFYDTEDSQYYSEKLINLGYDRMMGRFVSMHRPRDEARVFFDIDDDSTDDDLTPEQDGVPI